MTNPPAVRVVTLGDLLGPLVHLGACTACRAQFMSTHDRVVITPRGVVCTRCADRKAS